MSSIDKKELEKFAKISHEWWNEKGEFSILHQINPIRLDYIIDKITSHYDIKKSPVQLNSESFRQDEFKDEPAERTKVREHRRALKNSLVSSFLNDAVSFSKLDILDVGCGGGLISVPLSKSGFNITAIDALEGNIKTANEYAKKNNLTINYLQSTIEELPTNKLYDVIICLEVIEHIDNVPAFMLNLTKLVKPGGMAIISTINRTKKAYFLAIIAAEYILSWVPKNTHDYSKFLKPSEIYEILNPLAINIKELKGLVFDIAHNKWQLSDDIDVNYFMYLIKP
ncbi:bifunctional 2-polyprenyl-6-hydroxyphenol methylase/3-demethylubiquinol 3-O-methyltransferase UbiG [Rickettsia endosymbiont of Halotydeus destructor]|uniref:bifunctional 2-polyprenyl-6-hydroxyphenol methylase/3-demethylubiquinol 3-O-methyltransferase UbiG n=1 Tax=Rickettsia endosymbiont of Halotydeus destructor TaxID=2996754 RepID=UPI003BB1BC4F